MNLSRFATAFVASLAVCVICLRAADVQATNPVLESRDYDLHDLLTASPEYSSAPLNPDDPPLVVDKHVATQRVIDAVIGWIESTAQNGEPNLAVTENSTGGLTIVATAKQQERITRLIESRLSWRRTQITTESRFVSLTIASELRLPEEIQEKLAAMRAPTGHASVSLENEEVREIVMAGQLDANASRLAAPRMTTFNGQRAHLQIGTSRTFVAGYDRGDASGKSIPRTEDIFAGTTVDIRAVTDDRKNIALNLKADITRLVDMKKETITNSDGEQLIVEAPVVDQRTIDTPFAARSGESLGFGLLAGANADDQRGYLIITATVVPQN